jgi:hypothetical protein
MDEKDGLLAEYQTLRAEILQNDQLIQRMSMFAFWAIAAPLAAFSFKTPMSELLVLPPVAYLIYLLMVTHKLEGTVRIATYISKFIEPKVPGLGWETRIRKLNGGMPGVPTHVGLLLMATVGTLIPSITAAKGPHRYAAMGIAIIVFLYSVWQLGALKKLAGPEGFAAAWAQLPEDK